MFITVGFVIGALSTLSILFLGAGIIGKLTPNDKCNGCKCS